MSPSSFSATFPSHLPQTFSSLSRKKKILSSLSFKKPAAAPFICQKIGVEELAELAQNKALVAAAISSAIGQFSKPFTSALYGSGVDFRAAFRSGGMPSTHSAGVVAAATSLGLERGFSDSIFGMSVVFAAIVMYDAQVEKTTNHKPHVNCTHEGVMMWRAVTGNAHALYAQERQTGVRKEVGCHAKILNKLLLETRESAIPYREEGDLTESKQGTSSLTSESLAPVLSLSEKGNAYRPNPMPPSIPRSENITSRLSAASSKAVDGEDMFRKATSISVDSEEMIREAYGSYVPLKEYVGHTEIEVLVGALLGFLVSIVVDTLI